MTSPRYVQSEALLKRALETIPGGTQTFSKSPTQYPHGVSPFFIERGDGASVWDVDGNEYVDFVSGLLAINLGYGDPDVTGAVQRQMADGVLFSLPHRVEMEMAERIVSMVPCAEMVRFGKNGSDATAGAIRLARAFTGRDHVVVCGYHGWQDWYIGSTTRDAGVPEATRALTHRFTYNDADSLAEVLEANRGQVAAVIMEALNAVEPEPGFLERVRTLCNEHEALLVFDEIITCFRFANGGAQAIYGVTPDLCSLGKGIANGYPLSAVAGRRDVMKLMEEIFFSFTLGGEALSLAAGCATLDKLEREPVTDTLRVRGTALMEGVGTLIERHGVGHFVSQSGHPAWSFLHFKDTADASLWEIKTLWMQECLARGILCLGTHNMSYAHSPAHVERLLACYDEVFPLLREAADNGAMRQLLRCKPLEPLFKVR